MKIPRHYLPAVCGCLVLNAVASAQNRAFTNQYSFGDSLSDSGNIFAATSALGAPNPPAPYFQGRFSNGRVFTEMLGNTLALAAATPNSVRSSLNFAFGGANAAGTSTLPPSLGVQVGLFQQRGITPQRMDLFTVLAGPNDMIPVLGAATTPGNPAALDIAGANFAQAVATNVQALIGLGAKNLVVLGMPNLGATPRALATGGAGGIGSTLGLRATNAFNNELRARLQTIATSSAGADVNLVYTDLHGVIDRIALDYRSLGYNNASSYYLAPGAAGGGSGDPNGYVFWDDIHPTTKTHSILAAIVTEQLNPEIPLGFAGTQGTAALALQGLATSALDARTSQLAVSNRALARMEAYAAFNYGDGTRARDGWRPKFNYTAQVVTAGVDLHARDGIFLGGAVNVGRLNADLSGGQGDFTVEDGTGRLYGVWRGGPVSLLIDANYGTLTVKGIHRATSFGGLRTNAKTSGDHWGAGLKAVWAVDIGAASVRPWFGLRTERVQLDSYTEKDVPALSMEFEEQDAKSNGGAVGVDAAMNWKLGSRTARLDLRGAWHGEINSQTRTVAGRLANNFTRPTAIAIEDGDGSGLELGGAVTLFFARNWSGSVGYAADIRSGERVAHRGTLSLQTGF
jgi:outer membrane lipase/esterase